jgi:NAD(P)-dependent dehydrogenase (short-subunit alcohol dehydrogenase family)
MNDPRDECHKVLNMNFEGKTTVVTGAAGGIGEALARRFHQAGARVVVADRDASRLGAVADSLNAIRPDSALAVVADISSEAGNVALIEAARNKFGFIHLFFANAGVAQGQFLENTDEETWDSVMNINTHAHRWAAKHLIGDWLAAGEGYFCSTASAAGLLSQIGSATYSVSKHAAVAFAEWMSITYGDRGIRVTCLCPQGVNTNMLNPPGADDGIDKRGGDVVKASGAVLEPSEVAEIVYNTIVEEKFLVMPHAEVHTFEKRKVDDRDRWLAGMRKLQNRIFNG